MKYRSLFVIGCFVFAAGFMTSLAGTAHAVPLACEDPCLTDNEEEGVLLCHVPPGNQNAARTVCLLVEDAEAHLLHHENDECGECDLTLLVDCENHHPVRCGDGCCDPSEAKRCEKTANCCEDDCSIE